MDGFESNVKIARANQLIFVQLLGLWEIEISTGWLKKTGISNQKPAWKAWCCESCLTSLPLPTGPYLTLYSIIIVSTSPIDINENIYKKKSQRYWMETIVFRDPGFFWSTVYVDIYWDICKPFLLPVLPYYFLALKSISGSGTNLVQQFGNMLP